MSAGCVGFGLSALMLTLLHNPAVSVRAFVGFFSAC